MKILFLAPRFHNIYYYRIKSLVEHDNKVEFLALREIFPERHDIIKPKVLGYSTFYKLVCWIFTVLINKKRSSVVFRLQYAWPPLWKFLYYFFKFDPDVIVVKNVGNIYSLIGLFLGRILGKKNIALVQIVKFYKNHKGRSLQISEKYFNARFISPMQADIGVKEKISYIPYVQEVKDFKKEYFKNDKINIISVAKFEKRKDIILLLKVFNRLKNKYPIRLTVIGQTKSRASKIYDRIIDLIKEKDLDNLVTVKSDIKWGELVREYKDNDLFVLPAYKEAAAVSPLEAMCRKLPVIVSDECGTKCYIKPGVNGYVFKARDLDSLTESIERIIKDRKNLVKMGEASFGIAKKDHVPEVFYKKFMAVVNSQ